MKKVETLHIADEMLVVRSTDHQELFVVTELVEYSAAIYIHNTLCHAEITEAAASFIEFHVGYLVTKIYHHLFKQKVHLLWLETDPMDFLYMVSPQELLLNFEKVYEEEED
ncbi:MAG: hypothetical protein H6600_03715 [Flavobacteriales bacterium]|nr:hypothetical protein [Flavobacteriales bacterium]